MRPARVYLGLGSNLDDPARQLCQALESLSRLPAVSLVAYSPLYRSAPVGGPPNQPDYLNAVAALDTALTPAQLLSLLQALEHSQGRVRTTRWGARTLDLDLLLYDQLISHDPSLTLPHPRLHERAFVLGPLHDIAPQLIIPGHGPVSELWANCQKHGLIRLEEPYSD